MAYRSNTAEFRADVSRLIAVYDAEGFAAADRAAHVIVAERGLNAAEALTVADAVRRAIILR